MIPSVSLRGCIALCAFAACCTAYPVLAQDGARTSAAARSLFQEGIACSDHADWACAVARFSEAYRLRPSPVIGSNYGIALMHVERWVEAAEAFRAVQRDASASAELRADAAHYIAEIEPRLGRLTIHTTGSRDGVTVTMDGNDATALVDVAAPSDPGDHLVELHRDGSVIASATGHVESGARVTVELAIPDRPAVAEPEVSVAPVVTEDPSRASVLDPSLAQDGPPVRHTEVYEQWWFWTIAGVVVAAGVAVPVGIVTSQGTVPPMGSLGTIDARL